MPQSVTPFLLSVVFATLIVISHPAFRGLDSSDPDSLRKLELESAEKPAPAEPVAYDIPYKRRLLRTLRLDVYGPLPASPRQVGAAGGSGPASGAGVIRGPAPVIVFFHGGSWIRGDKLTIRIVDRFLRRMREAGYFVVAANYTDSLLRGLGGPVENARDAVAWVAENADSYGFDPHRIGLYGVSAGAHLALMVASDPPEESLTISFAFAECAPTDLIAMRDGDAFGSSGVFRIFRESRLRALSPITHVSAMMPPVLLFHGDADRIVHVDQSRRYAVALERAGGDVELVEYPGGDHAFLNFPDEIWYEQETRALEYFEQAFARPNVRFR